MSSSSLGKRPNAAHMSEISCGLMRGLPFGSKSRIAWRPSAELGISSEAAGEAGKRDLELDAVIAVSHFVLRP
jgi:hypothetical protein